MATPAEHQRDLAELTGIAERDLRLVMDEVKSADEARDALMDTLPQLFAIYGTAAATLGADWYDDMRDASGVGGRFRAIPVEPPDSTRAEILARWAVGSLYQAEPDWDAAVERVTGGAQRVIADADRHTVIGSLREDPQGGGWRRQTVGTTCSFCIMLAGRGSVYSAHTADFSAHDHDDCVAVPEFGVVKNLKPYVPSQRFRTPEDREANNANVREYLKTGKPGKRGVAKSPGDNPTVDRDASRTTDQLRETLTSLEKSLAKFESAGTRARVDDLRRKIAARGD